MKKKFIISLLSLFPLMCAAQGDDIYEVPGLSPKNAIVRHMNGKTYIVYHEDGGNSHFSLVDIWGLSCIDFSTNLLGVKDFEIAGKKVYFCGNNGNPIFGFFDISTLFSLGTGMQTINVGGWHSGSCPERITDLMKLEAQLCNDGVHIYMIGCAEYDCWDTIFPNRCIVDMRYEAIPNLWYYQFAQEQSSIYYYDDVTITDNWVAVIGHKNGSCGHYNSSYVKPLSALTPLIPPPYTATYYYAGGTAEYLIDPNRPLMIEHLFNDYYAIVGHAKIVDLNPFDDWGTAISIYNGSANCVYRCYIPQGAADMANWELKDLRYNPNTQKLYLLQEMSNPISPALNSVMCVFDVDAVGNITASKAYYEDGIRYMSLDQCDKYWETVTVGNKTSLRLWHHDNGSSCVTEKNLPIIQLPLYNDVQYYFQYPILERPTPVPATGILKKHQIIKICGE